MYARVAEAKILRSQRDEALRLLQDLVVPRVRSEQGFKGLIVLIDPVTDDGMAITLWETEADMTNSWDVGSGRANIAAFMQLYAVPAMVDTYEVIVFEVPATQSPSSTSGQ